MLVQDTCVFRDRTPDMFRNAPVMGVFLFMGWMQYECSMHAISMEIQSSQKLPKAPKSTQVHQRLKIMHTDKIWSVFVIAMVALL